MGGKVLELESDRLIQKGLELGRTQGLEQGISQGISQGLAQSVSALLRKGKTVEEIADLLKAARHNEFEEHDKVYKEFGDVALSEGFDRVGHTFHMIAEIEKTHGMRFALYADLLESGRLFAAEQETAWVCLNCGYVYEGMIAPKYCPVCEHEQGYFVRLDQAPYTDIYDVKK